MLKKTCHHILLVEDDLALAEWIEDYLISKDFKVSKTMCGDEAVKLIKQLNPDLVLLDGMLPGMDGLDVCKTVRPDFENPIIMLTARDEEIDEVLGLAMGADDYITKPVRARVLLARIRLLLHKQDKINSYKQLGKSTIASEKLQFNNLSIDRQSRNVCLNQNKIKLSSNEFDVLWLLASNAGNIVRRDKLVSELRGFDYDGFDRSIDLRISRLRKKLGDNSSEPYRIKTIWGKGYLFAKDAW